MKIDSVNPRVAATLILVRDASMVRDASSGLTGEVAMSRQRGWYCNTGESVSDLKGLAVPVSLNGEIYVISLVGPLQRMSPDVDAHAKALQKARLAMGE